MFQLLSCKLLKYHLPPTNKSSVITVIFHEYRRLDFQRHKQNKIDKFYVLMNNMKHIFGESSGGKVISMNKCHIISLILNC